MGLPWLDPSGLLLCSYVPGICKLSLQMGGLADGFPASCAVPGGAWMDHLARLGFRELIHVPSEHDAVRPLWTPLGVRRKLSDLTHPLRFGSALMFWLLFYPTLSPRSSRQSRWLIGGGCSPVPTVCSHFSSFKEKELQNSFSFEVPS